MLGFSRVAVLKAAEEAVAVKGNSQSKVQTACPPLQDERGLPWDGWAIGIACSTVVCRNAQNMPTCNHASKCCDDQN